MVESSYWLGDYASLADCRCSSSIFFWMSAELRIFSAEGLFLGFCWSMSLMMWANSLEYLLPIGGYTPRVTALNSPYISSALKGGYKVVISYMTQPSDQMSDLES